MRTIVVDDEQLALDKFEAYTAQLPEIELIGRFTSPLQALAFAEDNQIELAFLDIRMAEMDGLTLSDRLRELYPDMIIMFVSSSEAFMRDAFCNRNADYYIMKPYSRRDMENAAARARLLSGRFQKRIYVHTFGRFSMFVDGAPVKFIGSRAKELMALYVDRRDDTVSNEEAYGLIWEGRPYDCVQMNVFHNAMKRLKDTLQSAGVGDMLVSFSREHKLDTTQFDCDAYQFLDGDPNAIQRFNGEYLTEYSWGEETCARLVHLKHLRDDRPVGVGIS